MSTTEGERLILEALRAAAAQIEMVTGRKSVIVIHPQGMGSPQMGEPTVKLGEYAGIPVMAHRAFAPSER